MNYGLYYSFDGLRWYFCGEAPNYSAATFSARAQAILRGASRWEVRDANEKVIGGGYS